jgi:beta-N-acetylhexosaminidase
MNAKSLSIAAEVALALAALALALQVDDPLLAGAREALRFAIYAVATAGVAWSWLGRRQFRLIPWAVVLLASACLQLSTEQRRRATLAAPPETLRLLGRHFIVGYRDRDEAERLVAQGGVGGIFVTARNVRGGDLADEIAHLQELRRRAGQAPLIVAADQEGGPVSRLSPPLPQAPALASLAALPSAMRRAAVHRQGAEMGRELARLGVTVDFAPVVDLAVAHRDARGALHTRISQRALSDDPQIVSEMARAFVEGLDAAGVRATAKHFPGLGRVDEDTHFFRAEIDAAQSELERRDLEPFQELLAHTDAWLMAGHVVAKAYDPEWPASQSKILIGGLVRRQWGFDGVIVTDDLAMGAVSRYDPCAGVVASLNAGVDLLLVSFDGAQFYPLMDCLLRAKDRGALDMEALARSARRLDRLSASAKP